MVYLCFLRGLIISESTPTHTTITYSLYPAQVLTVLQLVLPARCHLYTHAFHFVFITTYLDITYYFLSFLILSVLFDM